MRTRGWDRRGTWTGVVRLLGGVEDLLLEVSQFGSQGINGSAGGKREKTLRYVD